MKTGVAVASFDILRTRAYRPRRTSSADETPAEADDLGGLPSGEGKLRKIDIILQAKR